MLHKIFRLDFLEYLTFLLISTGVGNFPPASPLNYVPWFLTCYAFNHSICQRQFGW